MPDQPPLFMSPEHVRQMNALLAASEEVRDACAGLGRSYRIAYRLSGGPNGGEEYWETTLSPEGGIVFALEHPTGSADLTIRSPYSEHIQAMVRQRAGEDPGEVPTTMDGDPGVLQEIATPWQAARAAATIEVRFPDV